MTHPKRLRKPNISTNMPMNGHFKNTSRMPPKKHIVPRIFSLRAKKYMVRWGPMMRVIPDRKRIYAGMSI